MLRIRDLMHPEALRVLSGVLNNYTLYHRFRT